MTTTDSPTAGGVGGQGDEHVATAEVLAAHVPSLFKCRCGERIKYRPLPDPGEREAAWAAHVAPFIAALKETP